MQYQHSFLPYTTSSISQVACNHPVYYLIILYNSSGYEKTIRKENIQLTELKFYINIIKRCLGIVIILSASRQDHQWYALIKCATIVTSRVFKNNNNIQQASDIQMKPEQSTRPYIYNLQLYSPRLWYSINFKAIYSPTITIFLKVSPLYFYTIQSMFDNFYSKQEALEISESMNTPSYQRS